jgi:predicted DCC family thiol-disulfide oxidoreductase YuxK
MDKLVYPLISTSYLIMIRRDDMVDLEVLYNSECPICNREINHYKKISKNNINFIPISPETLKSWSLSEDQAAKKLHARLNGKQIDGVDAFQAIWDKLPYYRVLSKVIAIWPLKNISNLLYLKILAPLLFKLHKYRNKI